MAGEATIGALRVILGLDSAQFEDSLKSSMSSLGDFGKRMGEVAAGIGLEKAVEKTFGAIVESITSAIDAADKLSKASAKFGIPVETLGQLSNAAALSDVSLESLGNSLSKLSKNMVTAQGETSQQTSAFAALGISVKDSSGQLKSADQILNEVANSFTAFRDGTTKTALAVAIFGKAGADLIPVLNEGADGIKKISDRMGEFATISPETAKAAEQFNDTLKLMEKVSQNIVAQILGESGLLKAMNDVADAMLAAQASSGSLVDQFTGKLAAAIIEVRKALQDFNEFLTSTTAGFNALAQAGQQFANLDFAGAVASLGDALKAFGAGGTTQTFIDGMSGIGVAVANQAAGMNSLVKGVNDYFEAAKKASTAPPLFDPNRDKELQTFNDHLQKLTFQADDVSQKFAGQLAPGFLTAAASMKILKDQVTITSDGLVTLGPQAEQLNAALLKLKGAQLTQSELTPWDTFQQKIKSATLELNNAAISQDTFQKVAVKASGDAAAAYGNYFSNLQSGFQAASEQNKAYAIAAKAAAIASATINTYEAATKAYVLFGGFPFGAAAAAATIAAGLALVASIVATPLAKGGSFKVPGGISGVDTRTIPLALAPGERVDVTPASQGGRGRSREIVLSGIGPKDFFTGDMLRGLVDSLNQAQRDGYRLKVSTV